MLSPELQQQWHVEGNKLLGALKVKPNSNIKAVWQCDKCPAGQPHIWTATVANRTRKGTQCPYCSNKLVCSHNSLATIASAMAQYWNHSKNAKAPEQVLAGSSLRAEWICPACNWEWQASTAQRVRLRTGCPRCSRARKVNQPQPTFAEAQPACLAEWDHDRNDAEDIYPDNTTLGSNKKVHWICLCCPRGQPHRWTATPYNRVGAGSGCPACAGSGCPASAGKQACLCSSLESLFPSLAAEFDVDKSGFKPSEIRAQSNKEVWWRNVKRGSWKQSCRSRTQKSNQPYRPQE